MASNETPEWNQSPPTLPDQTPQLSQLPYRLMAPGPVPVHPEVLKKLALPLLHHRTPEFEKVFQESREKIKKVFLTKNPVFMLSCTGSGAMEAALVNTLSAGDKILILEIGKFGKRWSQVASSYGLSPNVMKFAWGESASPEKVRKELEKEDYQAIIFQACETSTGALNPVQELASLVRDNPNTLCIVDGITAVGATPLPMDEWGIDVLVAGSQKAFMLPTGMGFLSLSEKAQRFQGAAKLPRHYWDLNLELKANEKNQTYFSSNVSLIRALSVSLEIMLENGLSQHLKRIDRLAKGTQAACIELGLSIFPQMPSPSLTALLMPENTDGQRVRSHLESQYNITIAGGQDDFKGKLIRIGHMGYITNEDAIETIRCLGETLVDLYPKTFSQEQVLAATEKMKDALQ